MNDINNELLDIGEEDNIEDMYLNFGVGNEEYAVGIKYVTEIVGLQKIIEVPDVPTYIKGVINLRGKVIPVMDVRLRFNLPECEYTDRTVIIVLDVQDILTGLVVDRVNEVLDLPPEQIAPPPQQTGSDDSSVIEGMGKHNDEVSIILNVQRLLNNQQIEVRSDVLEMAAGS